MKKTAIALILVFTCFLSACSKEDSDKNETPTVPFDDKYEDKVDSFTFAEYNFTLSDNTDSFINYETTVPETEFVSDLNETETDTESNDNLCPTAPGLSDILPLLELEQVSTITEKDKYNQRIADEMMRDYFAYKGKSNLKYYTLGKCKFIGGDDSYADFIYVTQDSIDNGADYYYSVTPAERTIFVCYVASEGFLVWKDGSAPDEEKAIAFFDSVMGEKYNYGYIDVGGDGSYMFELYFDDDSSILAFVNWECDKIFITTGDRGAVEIYPNDVEGFLDNSDTY